MSRPQAIARPEHFLGEDLSLDLPEKTDGKWTSVVSFRSAPLYLQTPRLRVAEVSPESISVHVPEGDFRTLLEDIEGSCLSVISQRSTEFFNRKTPFTLDQVRGNHKSLVSNDGRVTLLLDQNVIVRNQFGAEKSVSDVLENSEVSIFAHASAVSFGRRSSEILVMALQTKLHMDPRPAAWQIEDTVSAPDHGADEISEETSDAISKAVTLPEVQDYFQDADE
jgi:hypothetical protein